jgi:hypothetical protein
MTSTTIAPIDLVDPLSGGGIKGYYRNFLNPVATGGGREARNLNKMGFFNAGNGQLGEIAINTLHRLVNEDGLLKNADGSIQIDTSTPYEDGYRAEHGSAAVPFSLSLATIIGNLADTLTRTRDLGQKIIQFLGQYIDHGDQAPKGKLDPLSALFADPVAVK